MHNGILPIHAYVFWVVLSDLRTTTLHASLLFPMRATFPVHLIHFDVITQMIFGEEYRT
jgi:hypothetical protein